MDCGRIEEERKQNIQHSIIYKRFDLAMCSQLTKKRKISSLDCEPKRKLVKYRDHGIPDNLCEPKRKLVNYRDHGIPDNLCDKKIRLLAGHILHIISYIEQNEWIYADSALLDNEKAKLCGLRIDSPFKVCRDVDSAVAFARGKAMFFRNNSKIRLPQVAIGGNNFCTENWKYPSDIEKLAKKIFPIWLEEWIHAFQFLISGVVCDESILFQNSPQFKDTWDIDEVDVYAIYISLGWNVEILNGMESIYDERIAFTAFSRKSKV